MTRSCVAALLTLIAVAAAGCADSKPPAPGPAAAPYRGPLYLTRSEAEPPDAGAAGNVVRCDNWGGGGFQDADVYADGATADSPEHAIVTAYHEGITDPDGLAVAKRETDRVLYVWAVDGVVKRAVIVHNGPATPGAGGPGWYVESWASCDPADLPRAYNDALGLQIWTDDSGRPVSTHKVKSWHLDDDCLANDTVEIDKHIYGVPLPGHGRYFVARYQAHADLPGNAVDTGYQREGVHLWLDPDRRAAYLGQPADVAVWPAVEDGVGCG